ncbi:MAG: S-layer homology domain-containing protein [Candidatus Gracilibacteria bacterium]
MPSIFNRFIKVLGVVLLVGIVATPLANASFTDVSATNPNYSAINSLVESGILEGYEDSSFKPDQEVNRAEALKIVLMGMGVTIGTDATSTFTDVPAMEWYAKYVATAVSLGIVNGYEDNTFKPEQTVNRAEAIKMLTLAGSVSVNNPSESPFLDVAVSSWYAPYAFYAKNFNIEPAQTDGLWHGEETISRANLSEMVYREQIVKSSGSAFTESTNWLRTDFPTVDISMKIPFNWGVKQEGVGAVFLLDSANNQMSLLTPYENGGTLLMTRYGNPNGKTANELFASIKASTNFETDQPTIGGFDTLVLYHQNDVYYREWYIMLPNNSLVNLLAMHGDGAYSPYLEQSFISIVNSIEFDESVSGMTIDEIVENLREAIQVDGTGSDMMSLLTDWELFETDAIGVGTGPVDYYYSPSANITIKYERSYDVILNIMEGKTSSF